jgi:hypothetical protein
MSDEHSSFAPDFRLLVVFPNMKHFGNEEVQKIWTDDIVLPSMFRCIPSTKPNYIPRSYEMLRLNSQVQRVELGLDVGDALECVLIYSDNLHQIWEDIEIKTQRPGFEQFRGAFVVAFGKWDPPSTLSHSMEGAWKSATDGFWGREIDTNYIPTETWEVRIQTQFGASS